MNPCERRETTWYSTKVADLQFGGFVHDIVGSDDVIRDMGHSIAVLRMRSLVSNERH